MGLILLPGEPQVIARSGSDRITSGLPVIQAANIICFQHTGAKRSSLGQSLPASFPPRQSGDGSLQKLTSRADIEETQGRKVKYPMIGDPELKVAKLYDMLPAEAGETCEGRTAANNATVRTVFVVGPDKKIKLMLSYPMSTGRNFDEV